MTREGEVRRAYGCRKCGHVWIGRHVRERCPKCDCGQKLRLKSLACPEPQQHGRKIKPTVEDWMSFLFRKKIAEAV